MLVTDFLRDVVCSCCCICLLCVFFWLFCVSIFFHCKSSLGVFQGVLVYVAGTPKVSVESPFKISAPLGLRKKIAFFLSCPLDKNMCAVSVCIFLRGRGALFWFSIIYRVFRVVLGMFHINARTVFRRGIHPALGFLVSPVALSKCSCRRQPGLDND